MWTYNTRARRARPVWQSFVTYETTPVHTPPPESCSSTARRQVYQARRRVRTFYHTHRYIYIFCVVIRHLDDTAHIDTKCYVHDTTSCRKKVSQCKYCRVYVRNITMVFRALFFHITRVTAEESSMIYFSRMVIASLNVPEFVCFLFIY